jgi:hypothetical protein
MHMLTLSTDGKALFTAGDKRVKTRDVDQLPGLKNGK